MITLFSLFTARKGPLYTAVLTGFLFWMLPLLGWGQTTIVNYDFNSATAYPVAPVTTASGITSVGTSSETFASVAGTPTGPAAYTPNVSGPAMNITNSSGATKYFQFSLDGASLPKYSAFKVYVQSQRSATGATTLTLQYSLNGVTYTPAGTFMPGNGSFTEGTFDLSSLAALNAPTNLFLRLVASGASGSGALRIDNFQVQAINTVDPFISSLAPATVAAGGPDLALTVVGSNFANGAVVSFNGQNLATTYNSATSLTALLPAAASANPGSYPIVVTNPVASGNVSSATTTFVITNVVPRWTGNAGTTSWFDAANWSTGTVPNAADVLLDHSFVAASYTVSFDQNTAVTINSLTVNPGVGDSIFVTVPPTNTVATALTITNTGTGAVALAIYNKGVVTNASGAVAGSFGIDVVGTGPTFFVYNGGSYRHATAIRHSAVAENLSGVVGTEQGIFDFRLSASAQASSTLTLSGRTYGTLILRNRPGQSATNYSGAASSLTIQGDLVIGPNATFAPSVNGDLRLAGNVRVQGNLQLTTTAAATTQVVLAGTKPQVLSGSIALLTGIGLVVNNPAGIVLATPLMLSGPLTLTNGIVTTTATNLLTIGSNSSISGSSTSFINGPLARQTLAGAVSNLTFPTGSGATYRPVVLNATAQDATTYLVTQKEGPAASPTTFLAGTAALPALTRVSRVRSYTVTPTPANNNFTGTITLSFDADDRVTQPSDAGFTIGKNSNATGWQNIGNGGVVVSASTTTGAAVGTITSQPFTSFSDFALASTNPDQTINPLPVTLTSFGATRQASGAVRVTWTTASEQRSDYFEVQRSLNGSVFVVVDKVAAKGTTAQAYTYASHDQLAPAAKIHYRLRQVDIDGTETFSPIVILAATDAATLALYPNPAHDYLTLPIAAGAEVKVIDLAGRVLQTTQLPASGILSVEALPAGTYLLRILLGDQPRLLRFTKQ